MKATNLNLLECNPYFYLTLLFRIGDMTINFGVEREDEVEEKKQQSKP
jgi:hypothetical protein